MAVEAQQQIYLGCATNATRERRKLAEMEEAAQQQLIAEYRCVELRVFFVSPGLDATPAGHCRLFVKKRKPLTDCLVWGFTHFALFAFFL
jgi:hypothetical protein